jgi:hypothetical protein
MGRRKTPVTVPENGRNGKISTRPAGARLEKALLLVISILRMDNGTIREAPPEERVTS